MSNCIAATTDPGLLNKYNVYGPGSKHKNSSDDKRRSIAVDLDKVELLFLIVAVLVGGGLCLH